MPEEPEGVGHAVDPSPSERAEVVRTAFKHRGNEDLDGINLPCVEKGPEDTASPFDEEIRHASMAEQVEHWDNRNRPFTRQRDCLNPFGSKEIKPVRRRLLGMNEPDRNLPGSP